MKPFSFALIIAGLLTGHPAFANNTAYEALRVVNARNTAYAGATIEVSGIQGLPQPSTWRVVVSDPMARGGVREFDVSGGQILSEKTPAGNRARSLQGTPLVVSNLNLDSSGAFTVANTYAVQSRIGFDSINYSLRSDPASLAPIWAVQLINADGVELANLRINATTGSIVSSQSTGTASAPAGDPYRTSNDGGFIGRTSETAQRVGESTGRGIRRGLGNVQEWLTGRRTIDQDD